MTDKKLTYKQSKFVELWTGNASETARLAGYADPRKAGFRCVNNANICQLLQEKRAEEVKPHVASRQDRQGFWTETMQDGDQKIEARLKSSELLGRSEGDFLERVQVAGTIEPEEDLRTYEEILKERGIPLPVFGPDITDMQPTPDVAEPQQALPEPQPVKPQLDIETILKSQERQVPPPEPEPKKKNRFVSADDDMNVVSPCARG